MVFDFLKKTDPICGMKEKNGRGLNKDGKWFCNNSCLKKYESEEHHKKGSCCH